MNPQLPLVMQASAAMGVIGNAEASAHVVRVDLVFNANPLRGEPDQTLSVLFQPGNALVFAQQLAEAATRAIQSEAAEQSISPGSKH